MEPGVFKENRKALNKSKDFTLRGQNVPMRGPSKTAVWCPWHVSSHALWPTRSRGQ